MKPMDWVKNEYPNAECRKIRTRFFGIYLEGLGGRPLYDPGFRLKQPDHKGASASDAWRNAFEQLSGEIAY